MLNLTPVFFFLSNGGVKGQFSNRAAELESEARSHSCYHNRIQFTLLLFDHLCGRLPY